MRYSFALFTCLFLLNWASAQNVGIGLTTGINAKLHIAKADSGVLILDNTMTFADSVKSRLYFKTDKFYTGAIGTHVVTAGLSRSRLGFFTYSTSNPNSLLERVSIDDGGLVGINTVVPTATLDLNGSLRLRGGSPGAGKVLTSDALGNAIWQTFGGGGNWSLTGNGGTNSTVNFLGTTDNEPLVFKHNNFPAGRFDYSLRNYFIGNQSGVVTTGQRNVGMGDSALVSNTSGNANVAIGSGALQQSNNYSNLVAIGDSALFKNGSFNDLGSIYNCTQNTAIGSKALYTNSQGSRNTAVGFEAGYKMGLGWSNTAFGAYAMRNGGGFGAEGNVAVGVYALDSNNNIHNTAVGAFSLRRNRTGVNNTSVGHSALSSNNGSFNSVLGVSAMSGNLSGTNNTAVGNGALANNVSGDYNTALGDNADIGGESFTHATAVGAGAYVMQSNSLVLGAIAGVNGASTSTNVGIGTPAPAHILDIQANSVFGGKAQLRLHETDNDYARMKFTNTSSTTFWDVAGLPHNTFANAQLNFYFSGFGDVLSLRGNGNATLAGTLTQLSDARLKQNIHSIPASLSRLLQLNGYQYQWRDQNKDQSMQMGVLAQEVEKFFPELVRKDERGFLSVNYSGLVPVLINAVKEQQQTIESLERRLTALEQKIKQ